MNVRFMKNNERRNGLMAKVKIVITHEEYGEFDIGDVPPGMIVELLRTGNSEWSLGDMGADWRQVKIELDGKEI